MDYKKIIASSERYIGSKEDALNRVEKHLQDHPKDYQSKISYLLNQSQLERERRKLSILEYKSKIQQYMED